MSNCEHLIENALSSIEEAKTFGADAHDSFVIEMNLPHNQEMLKKVNVTKEELWEIAQYIIYSYIPYIK